MVGDLPSDFGESSTNRPPAKGWTPLQATPTPPRSRPGPAVALAALALVVAVAALIMAITNSTRTTPPPQTTAPTYTAAETATAQRQLCDTYKLAARAVQVETNGSDKALARVALTNAAAMLDRAAADPALDVMHRDAARALANAFRTTTALASGGTDAQWQASLDDANSKDAVMKKVCGGG
ncbi:MAG: hypothetical protein ACLP3C_08835 [Mycobacterium sp.]|uniref:hypothetical protein n=1 Tax=Mycobacterium sp. TaxID=1785 RepID=UPI003F9B2847